MHTKSTILLKVATVEAIFDAQDPRNIPERNLSAEWLEYIFEVMNDKPRGHAIDLSLHVTNFGAWTPEILATTLHTEFRNYDKLLHRRLKDNFRLGRTSLGIALIALIFFTLMSELVHHVSEGFFQRTFEEGFLIIGWVALWRPVEILLYDWWPMYDRRRKIARILAGTITTKQA